MCANKSLDFIYLDCANKYKSLFFQVLFCHGKKTSNQFFGCIHQWNCFSTHSSQVFVCSALKSNSPPLSVWIHSWGRSNFSTRIWHRWECCAEFISLWQALCNIVNPKYSFLPNANEVWDKVICLQAYVCPRGGGSVPAPRGGCLVWSGGWLLLGGACFWGCLVGGGVPGLGVPGGDPPQMATAVGGTHPTGMYSCFPISSHTFWKEIKPWKKTEKDKDSAIILCLPVETKFRFSSYTILTDFIIVITVCMLSMCHSTHSPPFDLFAPITCC